MRFALVRWHERSLGNAKFRAGSLGRCSMRPDRGTDQQQPNSCLPCRCCMHAVTVACGLKLAFVNDVWDNGVTDVTVGVIAQG